MIHVGRDTIMGFLHRKPERRHLGEEAIFGAVVCVVLVIWNFFTLRLGLVWTLPLAFVWGWFSNDVWDLIRERFWYEVGEMGWIYRSRSVQRFAADRLEVEPNVYPPWMPEWAMDLYSRAQTREGLDTRLLPGDEQPATPFILPYRNWRRELARTVTLADQITEGFAKTAASAAKAAEALGAAFNDAAERLDRAFVGLGEVDLEAYEYPFLVADCFHPPRGNSDDLRKLIDDLRPNPVIAFNEEPHGFFGVLEKDTKITAHPGETVEINPKALEAAGLPKLRKDPIKFVDEDGETTSVWCPKCRGIHDLPVCS